MITHDLDTLFRTCTRVGVIVDGRMITRYAAGFCRTRILGYTEYFHGSRARARGAGARMDRDANYVAVGAFVLLVIAMAVSFVFWYTDQKDKRTYQRYEIYFKGTVSGLTAGSPVRYLGVDVGKVARIALDPQQRNRVEVIADIDSAAPIDAPHPGLAEPAGRDRTVVHRPGAGSEGDHARARWHRACNTR